MGDTVKITFSDNWEEITGLTINVEYSLQNVNTADLFLREAATQPGALEIGKRLLPAKSALIKKIDATPVWIRSKTTKGIAFYDPTS